MDLKEGMIAMKDGRVMTVQSGEMKLLEEDVTLEDGTRVSIDGMVSLTDGTTRKMKEGETFYPGSKPPETTTMPHMEDTETHNPG